MKLVVVNGAGKALGELKLSQELLRRPTILSERLERLIETALVSDVEPVNDRIVENTGKGMLESLDEDCEIMGVPLKLSEACMFDFDKHVNAIVEQEDAARNDHKKYTKLNYAQENAREYDARYKEKPQNLTRFKK